MRLLIKSAPIFLVVALLSFPRGVNAATLRVPQDYASLESAYDAAGNGDEILVSPGNYTVCLSGNRSKRVAIRAVNPATKSSPSQQTVLNSGCSHVIQFSTPLDNDGNFASGEVVEFSGFVLNDSDDGFSFESASGFVKDNIINSQSDDPIDIDGSSEARILGNILKNGGNDGIENRLHSFSSSRVIKMIFMGNIIYNNNNDGIQLIQESSSVTPRKYLIANNLIVGNGDVGLGTTTDTSQNTEGYPFNESMYVLNNTFIGNDQGGVLGGANVKLYNNIFYENRIAAVKNVSGNSNASNNLFFGNDSDYVNSNDQAPNVFSDPHFVNTNTPPDFSSFALSSGSPAIDAGRDVSGFYNEFGVAPPAVVGSAPDIGWKEFGGSSATPTPTITGDCLRPGDSNCDGKVDGFDYVAWWQNFNQNVSGGASRGDFDGNGYVDGFDYVIWWQNFGG